jgi:hypothetical protein
MRNRALHDALREFALEAAALLTDELRAGAELEFDVVDQQLSRGPVLYRYRPLVGEFIQSRWPRLRELPGRAAAAEALGAGAAAYLRVNGLPGAQAEPALQAMLERLYEDATSFGFPEERFERVYAEVEETLYQDALRTTVVAPIRGLELKAQRVDLGGGLTLAREDAVEAPAELLLAVEPDGLPGALLVLERYVAPDDRSLEEEARRRFERVVTGLRLWSPGAVGLGPLGWRRIGESRWQPLPLAGAPARGEPWKLLAGEEAALRGFLEAIDRAPRPGPVAWALARFELGCLRRVEVEALSDYILALSALLDAGGETGRASLPLRLAALCAEEGERRALQRRAELALSLERFLMGGGTTEGAELHDWIGPESPHTLIEELERHLRALLRDVLCGYLESGLAAVADDILLEVPDPPVIEARDLRDRAAEEDTSEIEALPEGAVRERLMADWGEHEDELEDEPEDEPGDEPEDGPGVTSSVDWDEDPHSYSAPV